jgi:hypothetical protein
MTPMQSQPVNSKSQLANEKVNQPAYLSLSDRINVGMEGKASLLGLKTGDNKREITAIYRAVLNRQIVLTPRKSIMWSLIIP